MLTETQYLSRKAALLGKLTGAEDIIRSVARWTPGYMEPWHLMPIARLFWRAEHERVRACVSVPPRHSKTETCSVALVRWMASHPGSNAAYISYAADLAKEKSRAMQEIATRAGLEVARDCRRAERWKLSNGACLTATGIRGQVTGKGFELIVVDDPVADRESADSMADRAHINRWVCGTLLTRLEPQASVVTVHTRWHPDDLIGELSRDPQWEVVNLPALNDNGDALWPARWPASELEYKRREIGDYDFSAQYLGQPRPRGCYLFREPTRYDKPNIAGARILIATDVAVTAKTSADYSAIVVGAFRRHDRLMYCDVLEVHRMQVEAPALVRQLAAIQARYSGALIGVEGAGVGRPVAQMLRGMDRGLRILELPVSGDKFCRAQPAAAAWNDGRLRIPTQAPWVQDFVGEVTRFTGQGDRHDDQVDALAHLVLMAQNHVSVTADNTPRAINTSLLNRH